MNHREFISEVENIFEQFATRPHSWNGNLREKEHSTRLKKFLKTPQLLDKFITYLIDVAKDQKKNQVANDLNNIEMNDVRVSTEEWISNTKRRIDLLISGGELCNKWAIIIENKIHTAPDEYHQIPDYVSAVENCQTSIGKAKVLAIVYLKSYIENSLPGDEECWSDYEKKVINPRLLSIAGYLPGERHRYSLHGGWFSLCNDLPNLTQGINAYMETLRAQAGESVNDDLMMRMYELMSKYKVPLKDVLAVSPAKIRPIDRPCFYRWVARQLVRACDAECFRNKRANGCKAAFFDLAISLGNSELRLALDVDCNALERNGVSLLVRYGRSVDKERIMKQLESCLSHLHFKFTKRGKQPSRLRYTGFSQEQCDRDLTFLKGEVQRLISGITKSRCLICAALKAI